MLNGRNKMLTALFFIVFVLGGAVGCCPCREVGATEAVFFADSAKIVHIDTMRVEVRDTIIVQRLEHSNERIETYRQSSLLSNKYCITTAVIEGDGKLLHHLYTRDSAMLPARVVEVERIVRDTIYHNTSESAERVITRQVKKPMSWIVKTHIIGFWVMAIGIYIRHRKKIIRVFAGWRN